MDIYDELKRRTKDTLTDLAILSGDISGNGASWQAVADTAVINLECLVLLMKSVRYGESHHGNYRLTGHVVFPSPKEIIDEIMEVK